MGVDVSHYNGSVDWEAVKGDGNGFAFCKATQGVTMIDSRLAENLSGMASAGIRRGVYHFLDLPADASQQAEHCMNAAEAVGYDFAADMPIALDLEPDPNYPGIEDRLGRDRVRAFVEHFSEAVQSRTGKMPILYGSKSWLDTYLGDGFGGHFLWLAHYAPTMGALPVGWNVWHFWQKDEFGTVAGIGSGSVDMDEWNHALGDIMTWQVTTP